MNKYLRMVIALVVLILIAGVISVDAASLSGIAAQMPWVSQLFIDGEDGIKNLSTAFVGPYQVPMVSYNITDHIYQAHAATAAVPGNCGPNNAWYCDSWQDSAIIPGTVSQMATVQYIDTHAIRWAYSTGTMIRGVYLELMNDMTFVNADWVDLIQLNKFGATLVGAPSLQIRSGGQYELAFTILDSGDLFPYSLVYMHYVGGSNTSCKDSGSPYQCDVIDTSLGFGSMGAASLEITDDGQRVGIAYYKSGVVMYAYPHTPGFGWPSNCGPGGNTWRCISIYSGTPTGTVGNVVKLAMGKTSGERGIAFTYDDELIPVTLYHADYVGSGGDCGYDLGPGGIGANRWQCDDLIYHYYQSSVSFSIDIDPEGYSVIAYDYRVDDLGNNDLYIVYPKARTGSPDPGWVAQHIDGAPVSMVETGALAALSLNGEGMGFISYLQQEDYELDDLKIAFQQYRVILPIVSKP
jgi:hypothetical protein